MPHIKSHKSSQPKVQNGLFRKARKRKRTSDEMVTSVHPMIQMQQTIGNQAVGRLIQTQLKVGKPGDQYEQEADRVADTVMHKPESHVQRQAEEKKEELHAQSTEKEEELKRQPEQEEKKETVAGKEISGHTPTITPKIQANIQSMRGSGKPLPNSARNFFEPRFGHDFSRVRVHHDTQAAETAQAVKAKAFTVRRDVVFGSGQYDPETNKGKRLLAHELTHVVQQKKDIYNSTILSGDFYVQRDISTPVEEYAKEADKNKPVKFSVGDVKIIIEPDATTLNKKWKNKAKTYLNIKWSKINYGYENNIITKFTDTQTEIRIQTIYGPGNSPADLSAYGKGTTEEDIKAGKTSLKYHEGRHGSDYLQYIMDNPIPQFLGAVGMSVKKFKDAINEYKKQWNEYKKQLDAFSKQRTDCVGIKATFCKEQ